MIFTSLRQAMLWLHSVLGLACTGVLFIAFFMGSLALYDSELDRWMLPQTRLPAPAVELSLDRQILPEVERLTTGQALEQWYVEMPNSRVPVLRLQTWDKQDQGQSAFIDPRIGSLVAAASSRGGDFFYRFHYMLHLEAGSLGLLLVGLASMAGLLVIVAGVQIHVRLFKDFFSFRPDKAPRRLLDLHNLSGVFALPFFLLILLSGLLISFPQYLPAGILAAYPEQSGEFASEARDTFKRPPLGQPGRLASLDAMAAHARTVWQGGEPAFIRVWHPGDAAAYVEIRRSLADRLSSDGEALFFDGASGQLLHQSRLKPAAATYSLLAGLHVAHFHQPLLRALYFLAGISGCLMLASGLLYWIEKRRLRLPEGRAGLGLIQVLAVSLITGLPMATLVMFTANRLLPETLEQRASWEVWLFFAAWLAATLHCCLVIYRNDVSCAPWRVQCALIAALAMAMPMLNGLTTGNYLWVSLSQAQWAVAGVDGALLLVAILAFSAWRRLSRRESRLVRLETVDDA